MKVQLRRVKNIVRAILPLPIWAKLRSVRLRSSIRNYKNKEVQRIFSGVPLTLHLADPLAAAWYGVDSPELPEIRFLRKHRLSAGARVFDAGAHQCVVALALAKIVGSNGKVIAVEANAHNAKIGRRNRELNRAYNLEVLEAAIAETSGTLIFNEGINGQVDDGTGAWGKKEVPAISLDDLAVQFGIPDVLFLDIEGYEERALRGAKNILQHRPDCFVEVHVGVGLEKFGGSVPQIVSYFPSEAFELFMASEEIHGPLPFDLAHPMTRSRFFLTAIGKTPFARKSES